MVLISSVTAPTQPQPLALPHHVSVHSPAQIRVAAPSTYPLQPNVNQKINILRKNPSTGGLDNISPFSRKINSLQTQKYSILRIYAQMSHNTVRQ
jgi:hypothetical protein